MAEAVREEAANPCQEDQTATDSVDSRSSFNSEDVQAGVKNIEAVSQTWTHWSLIAAYFG